ncbi:MAG: motility protein A, partial [Treponema sp.]|nr:motility protein A [Treponema sp.]
MDLATIIGFIGGVAMVFLGVFSGGSSIWNILDLPSVIITVGGSYMAIFVSSPMNMTLGLFGIISRCFKTY